MEIRIEKKGQRSRLLCIRADGSFTQSDLGPGLPYHDLAHYVSERFLGLNGGFFGQIAQGRSIVELSDKYVIPPLGPQALIAEVLARATGSMATGACLPDEFVPLVQAELTPEQQKLVSFLDNNIGKKILNEYNNIIKRYNDLPDETHLSLEWA